MLATRDYVRRNGFEQVIVALSGGIDSAVTAAIAADALGAEHVIGLLLPSPYSSEHSLTDAQELADNLGILPTSGDRPGHEGVRRDARRRAAAGGAHLRRRRQVDVAEENLQSRIRGMVVMALSNDTGALVLTTGNKSEYAVGYATLYGDMDGGFAPLKDVPKTLVFELARWRAPATVDPGQHDRQAPVGRAAPRPARPGLAAPLRGARRHHRGASRGRPGIAEIVAAGHDEDTVREVLRMIDRAEFKRRQSAPGPKVTRRAFGQERRVPITHGWRG